MSEERVRYSDLDDDGKRERIADMKDRAASTKEKYGKGSYYSWGETIRDIKEADGAGETAIAGAKWAGKSLFNIGKFTIAEVLPGLSKAAAEAAENKLKNKK